MAGISLRPYQEAAVEAIRGQWAGGVKNTLLVLPTGTGKTIVFCKLIEALVAEGERVLILAHREELLQQAADKLEASTGLRCAVEKAERRALGEWYRVTVGSVQTLMRESRLREYDPDYYSTIIIDEAHHCLSDSYQRVLDYFSEARVLGVTATPDRGDMRSLGQFFQSLAYEYSLPQAIRDGYLSPIRAETIPLQLDLHGVATQAGDYKSSDVGHALEPYLEAIAAEMEVHCRGRKTVVFLPLISTSVTFQQILQRHGFRAAEVHGGSADRTEILADFSAGRYDVLCNAMLLTEGWDCPDVDCIVVLRPTKVRSLYCQMVGRGTRLAPGKEYLLLLDFLWLTDRHDLVRPAHLICESADVADRMTERLAEAGAAVDLVEAEQLAASDVVAQREEALAKQLYEMRRRKRRLVDPIQYAMSIQAEDLSGYVPSFGWEAEQAKPTQLAALEKLGIDPDGIDCAGKAELLLNRLHSRIDAGLATPRQIRLLEQKGFRRVGDWPFSAANSMIARISANNWRVPAGIVPASYRPEVIPHG